MNIQPRLDNEFCQQFGTVLLMIFFILSSFKFRLSKGNSCSALTLTKLLTIQSVAYSFSKASDSTMAFPTLGHLCPEKAGFLVKRGRMNTSFKERFFALKLDPSGENYLYYCKGAAQYNRPVGRIPLRRATVHVKGVMEDGNHHFSILTVDRVFHLAAPTQKVMESWIDSILDASDTHKESLRNQELFTLSCDVYKQFSRRNRVCLE
ncbi:hypothetical protein P9112_010936 [Eukaryota sp. TZLM1-RC]